MSGIAWGARVEVFQSLVFDRRPYWQGLGWVGIEWGDLPAPRGDGFAGSYFFFTAWGWEKYGKSYVNQLEKMKTKYRVRMVSYPESSYIVYEDDFQFAMRTKVNLPSLELTAEYKIGQKVWHRVSFDEGIIVDMSDYDGQWDVKWAQANQIIPTPEHLMRSQRGEWPLPTLHEYWPEGIEGTV